jgi:predicted nucleic acid-binding protein
LADELETVHVPHVIDIEIAQVLRRYVLRGVIDEGLGATALRRWMDFDVERHPHQPFLGRIWRLRANVTAYDAVYLALVEALSTELVTGDRGLADVPGAAVAVKLI